MGTNYYLKIEDEKLHIGKSSAGWAFALRIYPDREIYDLQHWVKLFDYPYFIVDEYGRDISAVEMIDLITDREFPTSRQWDAGVMARNCAIPGPNGLLRTTRCAFHGKGTWDCIVEDFS